MEELIGQVIGMVRQMWRFRWYGLIAAWAVGLLGSVGILLIPNKYRNTAPASTSTPQSILKPLYVRNDRAAQRRAAGQHAEPYADQPSQHRSKLVRMADLDLKSTSKTSADGADRSPDGGDRGAQTPRRTISTRWPTATTTRRRPSAWCSRWSRSSSSPASVRAGGTPTRPRPSSTSRSSRTRPSSRDAERQAEGIQAAQHRDAVPDGKGCVEQAGGRSVPCSNRPNFNCCARPRMPVTQHGRR